jgi:hypothetical protein
MPMTVDGHLPERHAIGDFSPPPPPDVRKKPSSARGLLAARVFRPPVPVEVITRGETIAAITGTDIGGEVNLSSGPWEVEQGWWTDRPHVREYWDVELCRGGVYRLYRDDLVQGWFVDARYDA